MFRFAKFFQLHAGAYLSKMAPIYQRSIIFRWPQCSFSTNFRESKQPDQVWSSLIINNPTILEEVIHLMKDAPEQEAASFKELVEKVSSTQDLALWTEDELFTVICSITGVANDHYRKDNFSEALEIYSQASVLFQTFGFENTSWNLYNLSNLANTNFKLGNHDTAETYMDEVIANVPKTVDLEDGVVILYNSFCLKGDINMIKGQPNEALKSFNEALGQVEHLNAENQSYYLTMVYDFLGKTYQALNQPQIMIQEFQKGLARVTQLEGEDGPHIGFFYQGLAQTLRFTNQYEEAIPYLEKAHKINVKHYGEASPQATGDLIATIDIYFLLKQYDKCIELSSQVEKHLSDPEQIGSLSMILTASYFYQYNYKKAKQYFTQAIEKYGEVRGESIYTLALCYSQYANLLKETLNKEYMPEARNMYEKAYAIYSQLNDTHLMANLLPDMAEVIHYEGKTEEAIETFHKCLSQCQHEQNLQEQVQYCQFWLCLLYSQQQKYAKAIEHGEKALEMAKVNSIDDGELMSNAYNALGKVYEGAKMLKKSEEAFREMLKISYEKLGKDHSLVRMANQNLERVLLEIQKTEEKDKLQQRFKSRQ